MASTSGCKFDSPPPTSTPPSFPYDVFLSFRGIDTRNNFTSHLYDRLVEMAIHTFKDDDELHVGGDISQELTRAIEDSRIYIVVFSKNYAFSRWCLDELVKIMECEKKIVPKVVLPVFYDVEPSEVRNQTGSYYRAFGVHEVRFIMQLDMVRRWRAALTQAGNICGFDLGSSAQGSESRLISLIIKEVLSQLKPKKLFVAKHPVGLYSRINDVCSLLSSESDIVHLIGIWGMGGSGKTVIAKALYNEIHQKFDSSCFLANVREVSGQPNGLVSLQEQLISELLVRNSVKVGNVDRGMSVIGERSCRQKVLIVIDDLDHLSQVDALVGYRSWFRPGSLIIITTRDQHLLHQVQVDEIYEAKELNYGESMELFSLHSFNKKFPPNPYAVVAHKIVCYSKGLPLALEVLGSYLFGRTVQEWNSAFEKLQKIPRRKIQDTLKISYDGLDDDEEREIFLDIAFFFVGMDRDYVTEILNGCGFSAEIGINVLKDKCLLLPDNRKNELRMHDLVRDMGREIIRQSFPNEPSKRSRLWFHEDIIEEVLEGSKGTEATVGITVNSAPEEAIHLSTETFAGMHKLRLLQMSNVHLNGRFQHLSKRIRWIYWQKCPLACLPPDLHLTCLVSLDMQNGKMSKVSLGMQKLRHLRILNLSHCKNLTSTPDFTNVPKLLTLILEGCKNLRAIHQSIGHVPTLLFLNLKGCLKISSLPSGICRLKLLGCLNLNGCSNLQRLPENLGNIEFLRELYVDETAITQLPSSLVLLKNLTSLSLKGCNKNLLSKYVFSFSTSPQKFLPSSISGLSALRRLNLRDSNLSDNDIPADIGNLSVLQELDLAGNRISNLPSSFIQLTNLETLWLDNWSILQSLPQLPPNLEALAANNLPASTVNLPAHQNLLASAIAYIGRTTFVGKGVYILVHIFVTYFFIQLAFYPVSFTMLLVFFVLFTMYFCS